MCNIIIIHYLKHYTYVIVNCFLLVSKYKICYYQPMEKLDLTSFEKVYNSLIEVVSVYNSEPLNTIIRDSMIQRFEYTYSIALKMIKRYLAHSTFVLENIDSITFNEMIRTANKAGLLRSNLEKWDNYRQKRNLTSHTYDEKTAIEVVSIIEDFASEAEFLINKLKEKNN